MEETKYPKKSETKVKTFDVNIQIYACEGDDKTSEDILTLIYDLLLKENLIINGTVQERESYGY